MKHHSWIGVLVGCDECRRTKNRAHQKRVESAKRIYKKWRNR